MEGEPLICGWGIVFIYLCCLTTQVKETSHEKLLAYVMYMYCYMKKLLIAFCAMDVLLRNALQLTVAFESVLPYMLEGRVWEECSGNASSFNIFPASYHCVMMICATNADTIFPDTCLHQCLCP